MKTRIVIAFVLLAGLTAWAAPPPNSNSFYNTISQELKRSDPSELRGANWVLVPSEADFQAGKAIPFRYRKLAPSGLLPEEMSTAEKAAADRPGVLVIYVGLMAEIEDLDARIARWEAAKVDFAGKISAVLSRCDVVIAVLEGQKATAAVRMATILAALPDA